MTTALNIVTKALQKIGAIVKNESPSSDEANDGLSALNALISSWANDSMLVYARVRETLSLTAGDGVYTIGSGVYDLNTTKPTYIVEAHVRQGNIDYPLSIIPDEVFESAIADKTVRGLPTFINSDNGHNYITIRLYPLPDTNYTLYLLSEKPITGTYALSDDIDLPSGWERALIYNLAVELAPEYGQEIDQIVYKIAEDSKRYIKTAIMKNRSMDVNPLHIGRLNIYSGGYR